MLKRLASANYSALAQYHFLLPLSLWMHTSIRVASHLATGGTSYRGYATSRCKQLRILSPFIDAIGTTDTKIKGATRRYMSSRSLVDSISKAKGPSIWISLLDDIHANLAFETTLTEVEELSHSILFLWRNNKTVVIGRHQNPWTECNMQNMDKDGIKLVRRFSGGGAVYQDLGNTCFTFLSPKHEFSIENNNKIILTALQKAFGINGEISGRNDLTVEGKKFSGSAYKYMRHLSLHHGTILLDVDPTAFPSYLTPNKLKLQSKGIESVASRVINLKVTNPSITHEGVTEAIKKEFMEFHNVQEDSITVNVLDFDSEVLNDEAYTKHHSILKDWDWNYGKTPNFSHKLDRRFDWGTFEVYLYVQDAVIREVKVFSDALYPELIDAWNQALTGVIYSPQELMKAASGIKASPEHHRRIVEFSEWIRDEVKA